MADKRPQGWPVWQRLALAGLAGVLIGAGWIYLKPALTGNGTASAACAAATAAAARADPFAKGDVAAFQAAKAPEDLSHLAFEGPDGKNLTLASFSGKTVLLNLWATWCVPCRREMPALDRLQKDAGGSGFEVVAVNLDLNATDKAKAFLNEIGVSSLRFYADPSMRLFTDLRGRGLVLGLPTSFLIDPHGCRIGVVSGPAEWDGADAKALIKAANGTPAV